MIYRSKTNNLTFKYILILLCLALLLGGFRLLFPATWSRVVLSTSKPFLSITKSISSLSAEVTNSVHIGNGNGASNSELQQKIKDLETQLNDRNVLATENAQLREMVSRKGDRNSVTGVVLSKPTFTPYDTFIIDVGSNKGIKVNDVVLAGSSTAIGKISEVYPTLSKVTAYSSPDEKHTVFIGEKNLQAEAVGQGNGNFKVVLPEGSEVNVGDSIIVPDIIPTVFGVVEKIVPSDQPSFVNVLFKTPVSLNELYYVEVVQ